MIFHQLSREQIRHIVELHTDALKKLLHERGIGLLLSDATLDALAAEGYDPQFGARPLKRTIQRRLQNPLAMKLLEGAFKTGDVIEVVVESGKLEFRAAKPARKAEKTPA